MTRRSLSDIDIKDLIRGHLRTPWPEHVVLCIAASLVGASASLAVQNLTDAAATFSSGISILSALCAVVGAYVGRPAISKGYFSRKIDLSHVAFWIVAGLHGMLAQVILGQFISISDGTVSEHIVWIPTFCAIVGAYVGGYLFPMQIPSPLEKISDRATNG